MVDANVIRNVALIFKIEISVELMPKTSETGN